MTRPPDAPSPLDLDLMGGSVLFEVVVADITTLEVDAIVNAANTSLLGGGGVDGAIHSAAGPGLLEQCRTLGGCETGGAKITPGFGLVARHVIHAVGPVWRSGRQGEAGLLASCYRRALDIAVKHELKSIAFPAISTGVYRFPPQEAAEIAVNTVSSHPRVGSLERVVFCAFDQATADLHTRAIGRMRA
jgi:O-acetyl-ADP-ribose deacetylase